MDNWVKLLSIFLNSDSGSSCSIIGLRIRRIWISLIYSLPWALNKAWLLNNSIWLSLISSTIWLINRLVIYSIITGCRVNLGLSMEVSTIFSRGILSFNDCKCLLTCCNLEIDSKSSNNSDSETGSRLIANQ